MGIEIYSVNPTEGMTVIPSGWEGQDYSMVMADDFHRVTAERDALQQRLNAADEEIDRLRNQPAEQHRVEPAAWLFESPEGLEPVSGFTRDPITAKRFKDADWTVEQAYTHADPGEVERLRAEFEDLNSDYLKVCADFNEVVAKRDTLRAQLEEMTTYRNSGANEIIRLHDKLETMTADRDAEKAMKVKAREQRDRVTAQLAERDALLRDKSGDLIRMAAHLISAPLIALQDLQDEDKKMTRARVDHAVDVADARLKDAAYELRRIADALSASAESEVKP